MKLAMAEPTPAMEEGELQRRQQLRTERERAERAKSRADLRRRLGQALRSVCLGLITLAALLVFAINTGRFQAITSQITGSVATRADSHSILKQAALSHQLEVYAVTNNKITVTSPPPVVIIIKR